MEEIKSVFPSLFYYLRPATGTQKLERIVVTRCSQQGDVTEWEKCEKMKKYYKDSLRLDQETILIFLKKKTRLNPILATLSSVGGLKVWVLDWKMPLEQLFELVGIVVVVEGPLLPI